MRKNSRIGLAVVTLMVMVVAPSPDGQSVSPPTKVITADIVDFKIRIDAGSSRGIMQPEVYCGVTRC